MATLAGEPFGLRPPPGRDLLLRRFAPLRVEPGSWVSRVYGGATKLEVNSVHHQGLPGGGTEVLGRAQDAFVDAFRLTNSITLVVALVAGAFVWTSLRARGTGAGAEEPVVEPSLAFELSPASAPAAGDAEPTTTTA